MLFCVAHGKSISTRDDLFFTSSTTSCVRDRLSALDISTATAMQISLRGTSQEDSWSYRQEILITEIFGIDAGSDSTWNGMCSPANEHFNGYVVLRHLWDVLIAASRDCESKIGGISLQKPTSLQHTLNSDTVRYLFKAFKSGFYLTRDIPRAGWISNLACNRGIRCLCHLSQEELVITLYSHLDYHGCHQEEGAH